MSPVLSDSFFVNLIISSSALSCAAVFQILPSAIDLLLELHQQLLISLAEQVLKSSLGTEKIFNRKLFLRLIIQGPDPVFYLEQRPVARLHRQPADFDDLRRIVSPASRTRSHDI